MRAIGGDDNTAFVGSAIKGVATKVTREVFKVLLHRCVL